MSKLSTLKCSETTSQCDYLGIGVSLLCLIHCLALPFLALSFPLLQSITDSELIHWGLVIVIAGIVYQALYRSKRKHGQSRPLKIGGAGLALLLFGLILGDIFHIHSAETPLTILGSIFIITGHTLNLKASHSI